jgi:hypothetical protein
MKGDEQKISVRIFPDEKEEDCTVEESKDDLKRRNQSQRLESLARRSEMSKVKPHIYCIYTTSFLFQA